MLRLMKYMGVAVCLLLSAAVQGQDVEFNVEAPSVVASGEAFRIEFSLNAKPSQFTPPATFSGVDVLAGPTLSEGTSVSIINNNVTKKSSYTYTYVLQGRRLRWTGRPILPNRSTSRWSMVEVKVREVGAARALKRVSNLRIGSGPTICWCV